MDHDSFFEMKDLVKRAELINQMLSQEREEPLKKVAEKLGISYSRFCKEMRKGGFNYNQSKRQYEKVLSLSEFKKIQSIEESDVKTSGAVQFITNHLEELKELVKAYQEELILDKRVYRLDIPSTTKSLKLNEEIYNEFVELAKTRFPQYRISDLFSQALLDFIERYQAKHINKQ